jgi:hypothetical protein
VYLFLTVPEEKALAEKLGGAEPTTLVYVGKNGKVGEIKKGHLDKKTIEEGLARLVK